MRPKLVAFASSGTPEELAALPYLAAPSPRDHQQPCQPGPQPPRVAESLSSPTLKGYGELRVCPARTQRPPPAAIRPRSPPPHSRLPSSTRHQHRPPLSRPPLAVAPLAAQPRWQAHLHPHQHPQPHPQPQLLRRHQPQEPRQSRHQPPHRYPRSLHPRRPHRPKRLRPRRLRQRSRS